MGKILAIAVVLTALVGGSVANAGEEVPQEPRVLSERCEAWIAWLVDGNQGSMIVRVPRAALEHMAKDCLGRYGNAYEPSPIPPPPNKPPETEAPTPEPAAENPKINI